MNHDIRIGDTVLIRCEVVPTTEGSTRNLYPGFRVTKGGQVIKPDGVEVASVEHEIRVGDDVTDGKQVGKVIAIYEDHAWVKTASYNYPSIFMVGRLRRHKGPTP